MPQNKEELKNKILYRASYRGTKEMDIMMTKFVKSIIHDLNIDDLKELDLVVDKLKRHEWSFDNDPQCSLKNVIMDIIKDF